MNKPLLQQEDAARFARSRAHRIQSQTHLAFGVSSTPRASQRPTPVVIDHAEGVRLTDIDGNSYIDFALGYGPLILGHSPPEILAAIRAEMDKGLRTAAIHRGESELADLMAACVPSAEQTALVSTGSEAVQLALRIARATTGRMKVLKCRANYHGWLDSLQVANAPGNDGPATIGQDPDASRSVVIADWGDPDAIEALLDTSFAAVIVEPAAVNAGCFEPPAGYLQRLRDITRRHGVMLIFDEVITGFRHALGGAQQCYGVVPDLSILGKALGAGLPIGAISGTQAAMACLASGRLMHRGTFNGNPLSVAAAIACLKVLMADHVATYLRMTRVTADLCATINAQAARVNVAIHAQQSGAALQIFAGVREMDGMAGLGRVDRDKTVDFTAEMLRAGVFTLPRGLMYLSAIHTEQDIAETKIAIATAMTRYAARLAATAP